MKNPCSDTCLILAACTRVCQAKNNYGILVDGGVQRYREYMLNPNIRFTQRTKAIFKYYEDKSNQHNRDLIKISRRLSGQL